MLVAGADPAARDGAAWVRLGDSAGFCAVYTRTTWQKVQHHLKQPLAPKNAPPEIMEYETSKPTVTASELATYGAYAAYKKRFEVPETVVGSNFFADLL
jgi:hypothetical protein